ncbi:MAG: DUF87 domain-containing protein [Anaerolineales bacterium]|nr:DUF87 domain-containing protein [Anaerolineales bacterium]
MTSKPRYDPEDPAVVIKAMTDMFTIVAILMAALWISGVQMARLAFLAMLPIAIPGNIILRGPILLRWILARRANKNPLAPDELGLGHASEWPHAPVIINDQDREGHLAILGRMGSGKSTQMKYMAMQDVFQNRPIILIDPHSSLAEEMTLLCLSCGRIPVLIQPDPYHLHTVNLLETSSSYGPMDAARTATEGLIQVYLPYQQELPVRIQHLVTVAAYSLAAAEEGFTMLEMTRWLLQPNFRDYLARKVLQNTESQRWLESSQELNSLQWLNSLTRTQLHDQFQSSWTRLSIVLSHPSVQRMLGCSQGTFDFDEIRTGAPLLVAIGEETLHRTSHLVNALLITWITKRLLEAPRAAFQPLSLYVDELAEISPESFERLLRHARKRAVRLTVAVQAQTMLHRRLYGTLMGNVSNLLIFASSGPGVEELAREISRPDAAEKRGRSVTHYAELPRQFHQIASDMRDLPNHEFLLWQSKMPGPPIHCRGGVPSHPDIDAVQRARAFALEQRGRTVASIDEEIRRRTADLDAKFGPLHEFGAPEIPGTIAPW